MKARRKNGKENRVRAEYEHGKSHLSAEGSDGWKMRVNYSNYHFPFNANSLNFFGDGVDSGQAANEILSDDCKSGNDNDPLPVLRLHPLAINFIGTTFTPLLSFHYGI